MREADIVQVKAQARQKRRCLAPNWFLKWDLFASPMMFTYEPGNPAYRSTMGACVSLFTTLLTIIFVL